MDIALVVPEVDELYKRGGLADFGGSLPRTLKSLGHDVMVFMPFYKDMKLQYKFVFDLDSAKVYFTNLQNGVPVYVVRTSNSDMPKVRAEVQFGPYQNSLDTKILRHVSEFSRAIVSLADKLDFKPDVFHLNDWPSSFVGFFLRSNFDNAGLENSPIVFTIHNDRYRGTFVNCKPGQLQQQVLSSVDVEGHAKEKLSAILQQQLLAHPNHFDLSGLGESIADVVNTVSPGYAKYLGKDIAGIVNGIDSYNWNLADVLGLKPEGSSLEEVIQAKGNKKLKLQKRYGLAEDPGAFVISYLHRNSAEKNPKIVEESIPFMLQMYRTQFIGRSLEMRSDIGLKRKSAGLYNLSAETDFVGKEEEALIYAGSDLFLMPTLGEPCGYSAIKAMTVGTVPLVNHQGGLINVVVPFVSGHGNGLVFKTTNYGNLDLMSSVRDAYEMFRQKEAWNTLMLNGLNANFDWKNGSVQQYIELYNRAIELRKSRQK